MPCSQLSVENIPELAGLSVLSVGTRSSFDFPRCGRLTATTLWRRLTDSSRHGSLCREHSSLTEKRYVPPTPFWQRCSDGRCRPPLARQAQPAWSVLLR